MRNVIRETGHPKPLIVIANELNESILSDQITPMETTTKTQKSLFIYGYEYENAPNGHFLFSRKMGNLKKFTLTFWMYPLAGDRDLVVSSVPNVNYFFRFYHDAHCYLE